MSRRTLKKQQKRQASAFARLAELSRKKTDRDDDEFLALAAEQVPDPAASPLSEQWTEQWMEVAGRALRRSLARTDLPRLERLLRSLRRSPLIGATAEIAEVTELAKVAETVLDLEAGRLDVARSRLSALSQAGGGTSLPSGLLASLERLAEDGEPRRREPHSPYLQAAGNLLRILQGLEACAFLPAAKERNALARALQTLRTTAPSDDGDLRRLLDDAGRCLSLIADLAALDSKLARSREAAAAASSAAVAGWLRASGLRLSAVTAVTAASAVSEPPLLAPLRHAVRVAWRAILERVRTREGSAGIAALCLADPKALALDLDLPGGIPAGLEALRRRAQAQQLLAGRRQKELAELLRSCGRTVSDSGALAALWSLELWAYSRDTSPEEDGEDGDDLFASLSRISEPLPHRALVRLQEMAGEVGRRFPAEQRAEVARFLSEDLFLLCEQIPFCDHSAGAALLLLDLQPGAGAEIGLLIAGVAGAVASGSPRVLAAFDARIARRGGIQPGERALAQSLLRQAAHEDAATVARILKHLKPVFAGDPWSETAAFVAWERIETFTWDLDRAGSLSLVDRGSSGSLVDQVRLELDLLRPLLTGTPGFAGMELALDCWQPDRPAVTKQLQKFLAGDPRCESALAAFRVLQEALSPWAPRGVEAAVGRLAQVVIDRLDDRWHLWWNQVPALAAAADEPHLRRLEQKIREILASPDLQESSRNTLEKVLYTVLTIGSLKQANERARSRRLARGKKKPRKSRARQLRLEL